MLVAGCFGPTFPDGAFACGPDDACPAGLLCASDGLCRSSDPGGTPPDAGPGADADPGDPIADCNTAFALRDDFDDGAIDLQWVTSGSSEAGGTVTVSPPPSSSWHGLDTEVAYQFDGAYFAVEVLEVADEPVLYTQVGVGADDWSAYIEHSDGSIYGGVWYDDTETFIMIGDAVPYSPRNHRFWRVRFEAGVMYWETSADGQTWSILGTSTTERPPRPQVWPWFGIWNEGDSQPPASARFDNFNTGAPSAAVCASSSIQESFDDNATWRDHFDDASTDCSTGAGNGGFEFDLNASASAWCGWGSVNGYDITSDDVFIELPLPPSSDGGIAFTVGHRSSEDYAAIVLEGGMLWAEQGLNDSALDLSPSMPFSADTQGHWRIAEQDGSFHFYVGSSTASWNEIAVFPVRFDPSLVVIGVEAWTVNSRAVSARIDNLNIP